MQGERDKRTIGNDKNVLLKEDQITHDKGRTWLQETAKICKMGISSGDSSVSRDKHSLHRT